MEVLPTPTLNQQTLLAAQARTGASRLLVLTLERRLDPSLEATLTPLRAYPEYDNVLYEWRQGGPVAADANRQPFTHFTEGWYAEEKLSSGSFRWMSPQGNFVVITPRAGTLVFQARLRSIVPDNGVDLLVDGHPVATIDLPETDWKSCELLRAGVRGRAPTCATQPSPWPATSR